MSPKVSVIIPSYNHEKYIGLLIDSIYAQTFQDFELIVLDDGSKDGSVKLLQTLSQKHGFTFIPKENEGLCKTINRGLEHAQGEFVMIIGSDDILPLYRLQEQVAFLETHPDVDVVAGSVTQIDEEGRVIGLNQPRILGSITLDQTLKINRVSAATAMIRRSVYERWGTYKEDHVFEDYYMWLNVLFHGGKIVNTPNVWAFYRIVNSNLERKFNWYFKGVMQALSEFTPDPRIPAKIQHHTLIYSIKVALLLGSSALKTYEGPIKTLSFPRRLLVCMVAYTPTFIRHSVMKFLKLKT